MNVFQVERIPDSFESVEHYLNSFCCPLLEDTRAELSSKLGSISSSPYAQVISLDESKHRKMLYDVKVNWRSSSNEPSRMPFNGDIVVLTEAKPETISDFRRFNRTWSFGCITKISGDNDDTLLRVKVPKELEVEGRFSKLLYVVFITNITTSNRIWDALHSFGDAEVIKEVVCTNSTVRILNSLMHAHLVEYCSTFFHVKMNCSVASQFLIAIFLDNLFIQLCSFSPLFKGFHYFCFLDTKNHLTLKFEYRVKKIVICVLSRGMQFGLKTSD